MAHPLTEKRIKKQKELKQEISNLGAWIAPKHLDDDKFKRQLGIINQKIQFLVEAAIDEGMGDDE